MDEIIASFVKQALGKLTKENQTTDGTRQRVDRPGPSFRNRTDFEVLEFPKIKFIVDHRGQRLDRYGTLIDEDEYGPPIDIEPRPVVQIQKVETKSKKMTCDELIEIALRETYVKAKREEISRENQPYFVNFNKNGF